MAEDSQTPQANEADGNKRLRRVLLGWVLVPLLIIGALFAAGAHVGARHPDMFLTRAVLWMGGGEVERPPPVSEPTLAAPASLPSAESQPPELIELNFAWPVPAQAVVEQTVESLGVTARLRYRLEVEPQGEELLIHHREPRVLELDGEVVDGDSQEVQTEGQLLLAGFIPSFAVHPDGSFVRVVDLDGYVQQLRAALAASSEPHEAVEALLNSPQMEPMLTQNISEIWDIWAQMWMELEIKSDKGIRFESHDDVGECRVVGFDAQAVSLEFRIDHELSQAELREMFEPSARQQGELAKLEAELEDVKGGKNLLVTVILRRDTLLPLSASSELDTWVEFSGKPRQSTRDLSRYTFEWQ